MSSTIEPILAEWVSILGEDVRSVKHFSGRELWLLKAEDGTEYFLKRLGPWRNLPLADEARVLRFLSQQGIRVAEFLPTERAMLYAGEVEDSFVLMPKLPGDTFRSAELLDLEDTIGHAVAELHVALAKYPWSANSYTEDLVGSLERDLMLPSTVAGRFVKYREEMTEAIAKLPVQLAHGDLTPENILLQRTLMTPGFIDFDHLPLAPRIWDIAKYLSRRLRKRWRQNDLSASHGRLDHVAGFLRGYQAMSPLSSAELEALPAMIAAANVLEASYCMEISAGVLQRRKLSDHEDIEADTIEAAEWHLAHYEDARVAILSSF